MPTIDPQTEELAISNMEAKLKQRLAYRAFLADRPDYTKQYTDSYGNVYTIWPFRHPFKFEFVNIRTDKRKVREFARKKSMVNALRRVYTRNENRFRRAQRRKAERKQLRLLEKHVPSKSEILRAKIAKADTHIKELQTRIKRLHTAMKHWKRKKTGLVVAQRRMAVT